jgi:hypothetical protein
MMHFKRQNLKPLVYSLLRASLLNRALGNNALAAVSISSEIARAP